MPFSFLGNLPFRCSCLSTFLASLFCVLPFRSSLTPLFFSLLFEDFQSFWAYEQLEQAHGVISIIPHSCMYSCFFSLLFSSFPFFLFFRRTSRVICCPGRCYFFSLLFLFRSDLCSVLGVRDLETQAPGSTRGCGVVISRCATVCFSRGALRRPHRNDMHCCDDSTHHIAEPAQCRSGKPTRDGRGCLDSSSPGGGVSMVLLFCCFAILAVPPEHGSNGPREFLENHRGSVHYAPVKLVEER